MVDEASTPRMLLDIMEGAVSSVNKKIRDATMLSKGALIYKLNQPISVTKRIGSKYRKEPLIGGEEFQVKKVYFGKKKRPIFVFRQIGRSPSEAVEMMGEDAIEVLDGFGDFIEQVMDGGALAIVESRAREIEGFKSKADYEKEEAVKEKERAVKKKIIEKEEFYDDKDDYGSW